MLQKYQTQDASAHAMTEVALGLSMAFFAILIVALLSMGVAETPKQASQNTPETPQTQLHLVSTQQKQGKTAAQKQRPNLQFLFWHNQQFVDHKMRAVKLEALDHNQPVVLALPQNMPFSQIVSLKTQINHPNVSISPLSQEWKNYLEAKP